MTTTQQTPQRVFVTGGAGFIGAATIRALLAQNKEVLVLDNLFSGKLENLDLTHPNLEFVEGDILEYPLVYDLLQQCDAVLHLAAIASVPYSFEHPIYSFQVNVQGFLHICEAIRESDKQLPFVYASSAAVYGDAPDLPCDDEKPLAGHLLSPYALHKKEIEQHAMYYQKMFGISSLGLRYFNVYGTGQSPQSSYAGVISRFIKNYALQQPLTINGDGTQSRDFIHIDDVVTANLLALQTPRDGVVNIATGVATNLLEVVAILENLGGHAAETLFLPKRPGDVMASYGTVAKALQLLNFQAKVSLQAGIGSMLAGANPLS